MTSTELLILGRNDIHSDKFAAAAISYIYKAFGDFVRSKEIWPFSDKLNLGWQHSEGTEQDCTNAMRYLLRALEKYVEENEEVSTSSNTALTGDEAIKTLKYLINQIDNQIDIANETSENINVTSSNTSDDITKITAS